ncbi:MAG TPA: hypothetical protein VGD17_06860 [Chitinophagaceae bacterium]
MRSFPTIVTLLLTIFIAFLHSCTYKKEKIVNIPACDTADVSFTTRVQPILEANCNSCHGMGRNFGNISLDTYERVKQVAFGGRLLGSISHSPGFSPMPKNFNKLNECDIKAISTWINEGTKNN